MIRLRPFKPCDAETVVSWCKDEKTFLFWGGLRFGSFPLSADVMNQKYFAHNGDCGERDNFYPLTAFDESGVVGHFILRYLGGDNTILRFGWVIVDDSKRGQKIGQKMLALGLKYAFEIMRAATVTIGVIEQNTQAYQCYRAVGFRKSESLPDSFVELNGERCRIVELEITKEEYFSQNPLGETK